MTTSNLKRVLYGGAVTVGLTAGAFGMASAATTQLNPDPVPATTAPGATTTTSEIQTGPAAPDTAESNNPDDTSEPNVSGTGHADAPGQQDHQFEGVE